MTEEEKEKKRKQFGNIKNSFSDERITRKEVKEETQDLGKLNEIKRLQMMKKSGKSLTKEQRLLLEAHERNTQMNMIEFQKRQDRKKDKGNGLEM
ncbi:MAG: hypothetical protein Q4G09_02775 [Clostridia bacterium]|nr:hypothetical protein [Clostridia bacterium]